MNKCIYCESDVPRGNLCSSCRGKLPAVKHLVKQFELIKAVKARRDERERLKKLSGKY
jgi:hypothetical protein